MKQIANRAGVSISTVSLVLNNRDIGRVSPMSPSESATSPPNSVT